jgi:uncharacterized protein (UPF0335 family)
MTTLQASAQAQLCQFIEQIERLEEEKKALAADIKDKFLEAKGVGFDVKAMRDVLRLRKKSKTEREEEESILAVYMHALGMTPIETFIAEGEKAHASPQDIIDQMTQTEIGLASALSQVMPAGEAVIQAVTATRGSKQ